MFVVILQHNAKETHTNVCPYTLIQYSVACCARHASLQLKDWCNSSAFAEHMLPISASSFGEYSRVPCPPSRCFEHKKRSHNILQVASSNFTSEHRSIISDGLTTDKVKFVQCFNHILQNYSCFPLQREAVHRVRLLLSGHKRAGESALTGEAPPKHMLC